MQVYNKKVYPKKKEKKKSLMLKTLRHKKVLLAWTWDNIIIYIIPDDNCKVSHLPSKLKLLIWMHDN